MSMQQPVKSPSTQMRAMEQAQQDKRLTGSWVALVVAGKRQTEVAEGMVDLKMGRVESGIRGE